MIRKCTIVRNQTPHLEADGLVRMIMMAMTTLLEGGLKPSGMNISGLSKSRIIKAFHFETGGLRTSSSSPPYPESHWICWLCQRCQLKLNGCSVGKLYLFSYYINDRTKLTLTALRSRLRPDAVETIEVCGALHKKGLFVSMAQERSE